MEVDRHATCLLDPLPASAGKGRSFATGLLTRWGLEHLCDRVELLVSEVVTNAILHSRSPIEVSVVLSEEALRVEVCDESPLLPVRRTYSEESTTGRGLLLIEALSDRWGTESRPGGKVVWFELASGPAEGS